MAATHRSEMTTSSSIDGSAFTGSIGHRSFNSNLEKSISIRDGPSEGRVMLLGGGKPSVASQNGDLQPTTAALLDALSIDLRPHHLDLRRVINGATGALTDDPQSKSLKAYGVEELKRVRQRLLENEKEARSRVKQLTDAMAKLNKIQSMLQFKKRSRPESSTQERASIAAASGRMTTASHGKLISSAVTTHVSTADISGASRAGDKNKSINPSKRIRTSMADVRVEGRPSNLSVHRSSSIQERERDVLRPSSSLALPVEDKERMLPGTNQGGEKVKLKGRRSSAKSELSPAAMANGMSDGDRDHKWNAQHQRLSLDSSRTRPSEGHGFRSGPVHGITSIHKAEVSAQANGLNMRGLNKGDLDGVVPVGERGERSISSERERTSLKNEARVSPQQEAHPASLPTVTKAKSARAPRSSSVSSTNPSGHSSRASPLLETQDRPLGTPATKAQLSSGPSHRKRPAPSRSSSPPTVAQWGIQRPQKVRVARRANLNPPLGILIPSQDEANGAGESGTGRQEGSGSGSTITGPRSTTPVAISASSLARRVNVSSSQSLLQSKARAEQTTVSVGPSVSDDSDKDGEKAKEINKKVMPELGEAKMENLAQKTGSVLFSINKSHLVLKEEGCQGDGVRRQGRTGRVSVTPRVVTPVIASTPETCEIVPSSVKQLISARGMFDAKPNRPGRPPLKKDAVDRKPVTRQRRELSGNFDDDREELVRAIQSAVKFSVDASPVGFWKQVEPYFAYMIPADIDHLHQLTKEFEVDDTALQIPLCGDQLLKFEMMQSLGTQQLSPSSDVGSNKSIGVVNGSNETDGVSATRKFQRFETGCTNGGTQGSNGGFPHKFFSLSQRLMSAFINVEGTDEGDALRSSEEMFQDESVRESRLQESESPLHLGSQSGSECIDFDGGESDGDFGRLESESWSHGVRERRHSETFTVSNGHSHDSIGLVPGKDDDQGEGDNILANRSGECCGDRTSDGVFPSCKHSHKGPGKASEMTDWELQCHQMSLDDRLAQELHSIGLLPQQLPDLPQREDDEICEELRKLQCKLKEQVVSNKERITCLIRVVCAGRGSEERAREHLAMDKLVERAYTRRMNSRGSKGPVKGARAAALAFAKRVISKVRSFEAGHSCIVDSTLRDLLFCIPHKIREASIDKAQEVVSTEAPVLPSVDSPATGAHWTAQEKVEKDFVEDKSSPGDHNKRMTLKDEAWPIRAKKREALLEDVSGRGFNNCSGGSTKGKCSEQDRDGKGGLARDGNANIHPSESSRLGNVKGERKTKVKPRQKTRPLLKPMNGLLAKSLTEHQVSKDRASGQISTQKLVSFGEESIPIMPASEELGLGINVDAIVDLSQLPLPGMDEMTVPDMDPQVQDDMGSWFDFDDPSQPSDELVMGLDVPMDDLSDLGMMM